MHEHGTPAVDQGVGAGVAQKGWGLAGFGVGKEPQESCGFVSPTSSNFNPKGNKATSPIPEEFGVGAFLVPPRVPWSCASVLPSPHACWYRRNYSVEQSIAMYYSPPLRTIPYCFVQK